VAAISLIQASNQYLVCDATPDMNLPYTAAMWVYFRAGNSYIFELTVAANNNYDIVRFDTSERLRLYTLDSGTPISDSGATTGITGWHHIAVIRSGDGGNELSLYLDFVLECNVTNAADVSLRAAADRFSIGQSRQSASTGNEDHAGWKFWQAELTIAEVQREAIAYKAFRRADLFGEWDFSDASLTDKSGNGRDWTATNSPLPAEGPGIAWTKPQYLFHEDNIFIGGSVNEVLNLLITPINLY
tara:strand:- start:1881 stop:2612 length:732 start_codon:yes stop_codon:yes gene_type:complete